MAHWPVVRSVGHYRNIRQEIGNYDPDPGVMQATGPPYPALPFTTGHLTAGRTSYLGLTTGRTTVRRLARRKCECLPIAKSLYFISFITLFPFTVKPQIEAPGFGAQTVGRKTSWSKDVWANYFLGDRRLGDKLGRYGDSKLDDWATLFRRFGEMCERGETQN